MTKDQNIIEIGIDIETAADAAAVETLLESVEVKYGNTKDVDKRAEKEREVRAGLVKKAALDPYAGQILCAAICINGTATALCATDSLDYDGEPALDDPLATILANLMSASGHRASVAMATIAQALRARPSSRDPYSHQIADVLSSAEKPVTGARFVTFNGTRFDFPFILTRAMLNGCCAFCSPDMLAMLNPYRTSSRGQSNHFDVCQALGTLTTDADLGYKKNLAFFVNRILGQSVEHSLNWDGDDKSRLGEFWRRGPEERLRIGQNCCADVRTTMAIAARL